MIEKREKYSLEHYLQVNPQMMRLLRRILILMIPSNCKLIFPFDISLNKPLDLVYHAWNPHFIRVSGRLYSLVLNG